MCGAATITLSTYIQTHQNTHKHTHMIAFVQAYTHSHHSGMRQWTYEKAPRQPLERLKFTSHKTRMGSRLNGKLQYITMDTFVWTHSLAYTEWMVKYVCVLWHGIIHIYLPLNSLSFSIDSRAVFINVLQNRHAFMLFFILLLSLFLFFCFLILVLVLVCFDFYRNQAEEGNKCLVACLVSLGLIHSNSNYIVVRLPRWRNQNAEETTEKIRNT